MGNRSIALFLPRPQLVDSKGGSLPQLEHILWQHGRMSPPTVVVHLTVAFVCFVCVCLSGCVSMSGSGSLCVCGDKKTTCLAFHVNCGIKLRSFCLCARHLTD